MILISRVLSPLHSFQPLGSQRPRTLPSWTPAETLGQEPPPIQEAEGQPSSPYLDLMGGLFSFP